MITTFAIVLLVFGFVLATGAFISIIRRPIITSQAVWLSFQEVGIIEKDLVDCKEVILIADTVDVPGKHNYKEILYALIDNFLDGVEYNFLVSPEFYDKHGTTVRQKYGNLVNMAKDIDDGNGSAIGDFNLHRYPYNKPEEEYPYLFYRYTSESGEDSVLAFRGEKRGVGISDHYRRLEPEVAKSIFMQAFPFIYDVVAVEETNVHYGNFTNQNSVIRLDDKRKDLIRKLQ